MGENENQVYEIDLWKMLMVLKEKIITIAIVSICCALISWIYFSVIVSPQYEASINMIVNTQTDKITNDNITSAQKLVDTYAVIIKSNKVLNQVIEKLGLEMEYRELHDKVFIDSINNTQVMKISVRNTDVETAKKIVTVISEIAPAMVVEAVEAGSCKVVSLVEASKKPVYPNVQTYTLLAGLMGFFVCSALIVLKEILNDYIVDDNDIEKKLEIPVLGIIPDWEGN